MKLGYLGVGKMGLPMAARLLDGGHELWVNDVREEAMQPLLDRQARKAETPKALSDACETVVVSLPTLEVFRNVLNGPDGLLAGGAMRTLVNTCTVGTPFLDEVVAACAEKNVTVIDAPISGGVAGAEAGTLAVMVSGDTQKVEELRPVFEQWGRTVVVAGDKPGAAQVIKLTNNILFAVSLLATCEAMTMSQKAGVAPEATLEIVNNGTGQSFSSSSVFQQYLLADDKEFGAPLSILMKDMDLAIQQGELLGVPMWVCQAARLAMKHAIFQGRSDLEISRILEIVEAGMVR